MSGARVSLALLVLAGASIGAAAPRGGPSETPAAAAAATRSIATQLDEGIRLAEKGDLTAALDEFIAARERASGADWRAASFDVARALHERALARPLPDPPDAPGPRPEVGEVANARARLAAARGDLEAARDALLELRAADPDDAELPPALARVTGALRKVLELDAKWRELGTPRAEAVRGESAPQGPLKLGPSGNRSALGAPGRRTGASEEGSGENRVGPAENGTSIGGGSLTREDAQALLERLRQVDAERRAFERRRADAAAARAPGRS